MNKLSIISGLMVCAALSACGGKSKAPGQVIAKVNKEEISASQLNAVLANSKAQSPEQAAALKQQALEALIGQEVVVQAALEKKIDRSPEVIQAIEGAKREIISRAYMDSVGKEVKVSTQAEADTFFEANPALFSNRRVFKVNQVSFPVAAAAWPELGKALEPTKNLEEVITLLKARGIESQRTSGVLLKPETLPLELVKRLDGVKMGDVIVFRAAAGATAVEVAGITPAPVDRKDAGPMINQFLNNKSKSEAIAAEAKRLRAAAQVTYMGEFERKAAEAPAANAPAAIPAATTEKTDKKPDPMAEGIKGLK
jgi:EpsD family peptidyl-prolyl cis-trans isomerase